MEKEPHYSQAVFWINVEKIRPNPYQPRKEFNEDALLSLAESIRQYGVLQPLVVTRQEEVRDDGIMVMYELIAGERRLRAAKIAGLSQIPAVIRDKEDDGKAKLEIAIIENLQREDLNPVDRARAFERLAGEFNLKHVEIAQKIGKSREYVSNSLRMLMLPEELLQALTEGKITEGHTRPLLMLSDRLEEQKKLFQDILEKRITVREAEQLSRRIATDRARRPEVIFDRPTYELENKIAERLGTKVRIERREKGGKIMIEFFSPDELENILRVIADSDEEAGEKKAPTKKNDEGVSSAEQEENLYSIKDFSL